MDDYILTPFTIAIDTREQHPLQFLNYKADANQGYKPLIIRTQTMALKTGDYSLVGYESRIAIERKSLSDAYSTFGQDRERFERELERLAAMEFAAVVIEADWGTILNHPPPHTKFTPKSVFRSITAWEIRYGVHFWPCPTRNFAERRVLRTLQRFWLDEQEREKKREGAVCDAF